MFDQISQAIHGELKNIFRNKNKKYLFEPTPPTGV
jgi:hypothetical protein